MIDFIKTYFFRATIYLIVLLNTWGTLNYFVPNLKTGYSVLISVIVSHLLAPNLKYIQMKGESKIQLKWLFFPKPLVF